MYISWDLCSDYCACWWVYIYGSQNLDSQLGVIIAEEGTPSTHRTQRPHHDPLYQGSVFRLVKCSTRSVKDPAFAPAREAVISAVT